MTSPGSRKKTSPTDRGQITFAGSRVGLAVAEGHYQHYGRRARELKAAGHRIIGYLCAYVPLEIITAAGLIPFRIRGDASESIAAADALMETIVCSRVRSCFDLSLKGRCDFLDGLVVPHACDSIARTYPVWKYTLALPYSHFIDVPHLTDDSSLRFFKNVLHTFRKNLGKFAGHEISDAALARATHLHNQDRAAVGDLYELRKPSPPFISGTELARTLVAAISLPVEESIRLLESVAAEVRQRSPTPPAKRARIMVVGAEVSDVVFEVVERAGANVVADYVCPGARENLPAAAVTPDPMDGIAERYLRKINCPRTYFEQKGAPTECLEQRYGDIRRSIKDYRVDGVILYFYRYCDPFGFEMPAMKSYLDSLEVPVLFIEDEYSLPSSARLTTRVQAFLELIESRR